MSNGHYALFLGLIGVLSAILVACSEPDPTPGVIDDREPALQLAPNTQPTESPATTATPPARSAAVVVPTEIPVAAAPAPVASFTADVTTGSAPVVVSLQNTSSETASSVEWDFGDGSKSTEQSPTHRYTVAGIYTVQLTVAGPGGTDSTQMVDFVTVTPGPLAYLEISPAEASVLVQDAVQFTVMGTDEFGNELPATAAWSVVSGGGSIDDNGRFTADTRAGSFPDTVQASLQTDAGEITTTASVTVEPGELVSVTLEPPEVTLDIGDSQSFSFAAQDTFGNSISDALAAWTTPTVAGAIEGAGVFTAGTKAGEYPGAIRVEVVKGASRASASANLSIKVGPLAQIKIKSEEAIVERGENFQFDAVAQDQYGNEISEVAFLWETDGGSIDQEGVFIAGEDPGSYQVWVSARFEGNTNIAFETVLIPPVWISVGDMNWARSRHVAAVLPDDKVLIAGTWDNPEVFDLNTRMFQPLEKGFCNHGGASTATPLKDDKVLIVGGFGDPRCAQIFDPATNTFHRVGDLNEGHIRHTATLLPDGKVLIAGGRRHLEGEGNAETHSVTELYDPVTETFSRTGNLNVNRTVHTANLLPSGKVLIAGGQDRKVINGEGVRIAIHESAELYDPATGAFTFVPGGTNHYRAATSLLQDGNVLFTTQGSGFKMIFDSNQERFRETGSLPFTLLGLITSTPLLNGKVLIVGGVDSNLRNITTVEIYDPASETYSITAGLTEPRSAHTATLLSNGWVLVTGGETDDESKTRLRSAELFIPSNLP